MLYFKSIYVDKGKQKGYNENMKERWKQMTVKELIEELKNMPDDNLVFVSWSETSYEVKEIIQSYDGVHIW